MRNSGEWFKDWFDSPYYHILYKNRDDVEAKMFLDRLVGKLDFSREDHILDLACGKGRHSIYLNENGFDIKGADLSKENITYARQHENDRLCFFEHDMRKPIPYGPYDYVLNLFTSFGYFETEEENIQTFKNISACLSDCGQVVIDFMNTSKVISNLKKKETKTIDGIDFHIERTLEDNFIVKNIRFEDRGEKYFFQERVKAIKESDFLDYFKKGDLEVVSMHGDYRLSAFDKNSSDRMIFVLQQIC